MGHLLLNLVPDGNFQTLQGAAEEVMLHLSNQSNSVMYSLLDYSIRLKELGLLNVSLPSSVSVAEPLEPSSVQ